MVPLLTQAFSFAVCGAISSVSLCPFPPFLRAKLTLSSLARSAYNDPNPKGLQAYLNLISQRAKIEGVRLLSLVERTG